MIGPGGRVVVVGGGVVGAACAHFLRDAGALVTLIDRGEVGAPPDICVSLRMD